MLFANNLTYDVESNNSDFVQLQKYDIFEEENEISHNFIIEINDSINEMDDYINININIEDYIDKNDDFMFDVNENNYYFNQNSYEDFKKENNYYFNQNSYEDFKKENNYYFNQNSYEDFKKENNDYDGYLSLIKIYFIRLFF
jgi:hypothetical protein